MAKVRSPYLNEIRGSIETHLNPKTFKTYPDKRKIVLLSNKPIPTDRKTEAQLNQRTLFRKAVNAWNQLSDEEKQQYKQEATAYGLTGYQYFIKQFLLNPPAEEQILWLEEFNELPTAPPYSEVDLTPDIYVQNGKIWIATQEGQISDMNLYFALSEPLSPPFKLEVKTEGAPHGIYFDCYDGETMNYYIRGYLDLGNQEIGAIKDDGTQSLEDINPLTSLNGGIYEIVFKRDSTEIYENGQALLYSTEITAGEWTFTYFHLEIGGFYLIGPAFAVDYFKLVKL